MNLSLTRGGNVNYYESVHHPIPTLANREHPDNFQNKSVKYPFNWESSYILFLAKLKGKESSFLEGAIALVCRKKWKNLSLSETWNDPTPPLFFIRPPYK